MSKNKVRYAFVCLNWNKAEDTIECINSLVAIKYDENFDIIVVDNGSKEESIRSIETHIEKIPSKFKSNLKFIKLPKNTGFTGGHIAGLGNTTAQYICLLNNDAVVDMNILKECDVKLSELGDKVGAIGGRAHFWNNQQKAFDPWNEFFTYQKIDPVTATAYTIKGDPGESLAPRIVDNVSGACVFVNREAIEKAGYLDDDFFAYYEETDMFARFKLLGYEIYYCPTIKYWHRFEPGEGSHGASTKHLKGFSQRLIFRNQFLFALKNFESRYLLKFFAWYYGRLLRSMVAYPFSSDKFTKRLIISTSFYNTMTLYRSLSKRSSVKHIRDGGDIGYNSLIIAQAQKKTAVLNADSFEENILDYITEKTEPNDIVHLRKKKCTLLMDHRCVDLTMSEKNNYVYSLAGSMARTEFVVILNGSSTFRDIKKEYEQEKDTTIPYKNEKSTVFAFNRAFLYQLAGQQLGINESTNWEQKPSSKNNPLFVYLKPKVLKLENAVNLLLDYLKYRKSFGGYVDVLRSLIGIAINTPFRPRHVLSTMRKGAHEHRQTALKNQKNEAFSLNNDLELKNFDIKNIPVFINCRDRVDALKKTIVGLRRAGFEELYLVDNQSTYPGLLKYYNSCAEQVVLLGENMGHKGPWESLTVKLLSGGRPYALTDPDIVLPPSFTDKVTEKVLELMDDNPGYVKIGVALSIDDIPAHYSHQKTVQNWEKQFWKKKIKNKQGLEVYDAEIDTTFAIYRPNLGYITLPSMRIAGKYAAKHLPWYQVSAKPTKEEDYYRKHASSAVNTWDKDTVPEYLKDYIS